MKPNFKARELWLLLPFLLVGAVAFYWQRVERVSAPGVRGTYVSSVKVEPAPGYYQEKGLSHQTTVTISHPWPRPKWWGGPYHSISGIDALQTEKTYPISRDLARGEAITIVRKGKTKQLPIQYGGNYMNFRFDGADYVSVNYLGLNAIPREWGAVTFHGLYRIVGQPQLILKREVRKAGEILPVAIDKNPGARLVKVTASPFTTGPCEPGSGAGCLRDEVNLTVQIRRTQPSALPPEKQSIRTDVEIEDEAGVIYPPWTTPGFNLEFGEAAPQQSAGQEFPLEERIIGINLEQSLRTQGKLKVRGKVSVDNRWPIPFEVKLPPRP